VDLVFGDAVELARDELLHHAIRHVGARLEQLITQLQAAGQESAGISIHSNFWPRDSSSKTAARIFTRSQTPRNVSSAPSG
jgi:hypothetical protein